MQCADRSLSGRTALWSDGVMVMPCWGAHLPHAAADTALLLAGKGVFDRSIAALRTLNEHGFVRSCPLNPPGITRSFCLRWPAVAVCLEGSHMPPSACRLCPPCASAPVSGGG
jgi:hypothetical protein